VDVLPLLLEVAGLPIPEGLDGQVWKESTAQDTPRLVYGETFHPRYHFGFSELRVLQDATHRYVQAPEPELYDWRSDPGELDNQVLRTPARAEEWSARVEDFLASRTPTTMGNTALDHETREALAGLGYLAAGNSVPADESWKDLPDPKSQPDILARFEAAVTLARSRPPDQGALVLKAFLEEFPNVAGARQMLSQALELSDQPQQALEVLLPLLEVRPDDPTLLTRKGELQLAMGDDKGAEATLKRALERQPSYPGPYALIAESYRRRGQCDTAMTYVKAGLERAPDSSRCLLVQGTCMQQQGMWEESVPVLRRVIESNPQNQDVHYLLGMALAQTGDLNGAVAHFGQQRKIQPNHVLAQAGQGLALYKLAAFQQAIALLGPIAEREELGEEPALALADSLIRTGGDLARAERLLTLAEARNPGDSRVHQIRSAWHMERGEIQQALDEMTRARVGSSQ